MTSKERCLASLRGEARDYAPSFPLLMFLAQDRLGITYREFASNGRATAEAQLHILDRFAVDAITACTDAFRVVADLGAEMQFPEDKPPFAVRPVVRGEADLDRLPRPDPLQPGSRMADRVLAVREMTVAAGDEHLVLGWVDMPFAEACSLCGVSELMMLLYDDPRLAHRILDSLTDIVIDFALAQLEAGAPMIGAGDAAASLVSPPFYRDFALPYEQRVTEAVHAAGGLLKLHICGNTTDLLPDIARSGADLYNVDHLVDFAAARDVYDPAGLCFKGNLDPVSEMMQATPAECRDRCFRCLEMAGDARYMLSAGCEVPADTPDAVLTAFCNAPAEFAASRRANARER